MKKKRILLLSTLFIGLLGCTHGNSNPSNNDSSNFLPSIGDISVDHGGESVFPTSDSLNDSETPKEEVSLLRVEGAILHEMKKEVLIYVDQLTPTVSLEHRVQCSENATWKLAYDALGEEEIYSKVAEREEGNLQAGENIFYIIVTSLDGRSVEVYTLNIFKLDDSLQYLEYENCLYYGNEENPYVALVKIKDKTVEEANIHPDTKFIMYGAFSSCSSLTSVTLPNGVITIEDHAFYHCVLLESVTIPNSVTRIGYEAFSRCESLASIYIPSTVTSIEDYAFQGCNSLTIYCEVNCKPNRWDSTWNYSERPVYWAIIKEDFITIDHVQYLKRDGNVAITGCDKTLTSVVIKKEIEFNGEIYPVTSIERNAFQNCKVIESVTFEEESALTSIGEFAFMSCRKLTTIEIPSSVKAIKEGAFSGCSLLSSVTLANQIENIGDWVFYQCESLNSITIPKSVKKIGISAFRECGKLSKITFEEGSKLESIQNYAFMKCSALSSIEIPSSVTTIQDHVFYGCSSFTSIVVPDNVTTLGDGVFEFCNSLVSVLLPSNITSIPDFTFHGCSSLTSIEIPARVTSIGGSAFEKCTLLKFVKIPSGVTIIKDYAFRGCSSLTMVALPNKMTSIGYGAFLECSGLTSISIPSGVKKIEDLTFENCNSLASITLPSGVTSIGYRAFQHCNSLTSIVIPLNVTSIGGYAFNMCDLLTIHCEASGQPSGWDSHWNESNCPVEWGWKE